jgi:hypothetical protein
MTREMRASLESAVSPESQAETGIKFNVSSAAALDLSRRFPRAFAYGAPFI